MIHAAFDRRFRRQLLSNPRRAIERTFGLVLPPTLRLKFIEKGAELDLLVVLPDSVEAG